MGWRGRWITIQSETQHPLEWLPENHLAYFVLDVVDEVELSAIEISIQSKDRTRLE